MAAVQTLEGLVIQDPLLRGGRPIIAGTGVTVRTIVGHDKLGLTPEEIADDMEIELSGVYAGLAFYHLNRDQIEADTLANSEESVMKSIGCVGENACCANKTSNRRGMRWAGKRVPETTDRPPAHLVPHTHQPKPNR